MKIGSIEFHPELTSLFSILTVLLGVFLWWLIRKKRKRIWLPTLRILELETRQLPKLRLSVPNLIPFIIFLILSLILSALTFRPSIIAYKPFTTEKNRIHIYMDMSPSVSAHIKIDEYIDRVEKVVSEMETYGRISISTSHDQEIFFVEKSENLRDWVRKRGFHRAGLKLGESFRALLGKLGKIDKIILFSDSDKGSWHGFNWFRLKNDFSFSFSSVEDPQSAGKVNYFINQVKFLSEPSDSNLDWEIEIYRSRLGESEKGIIESSLSGVVLSRTQWNFPSGKDVIKLKVSWPLSSMKAISREGSTPIQWLLKTGNGDLISSDDSFRTTVRGVKKDVLVISEPVGERFLDDPAHHLVTSLQVLGFNVKRADRVDNVSHISKYPLVIILGGTSRNINSWCPDELTVSKRRQKPTDSIIWLVPRGHDSSFADICSCYARLLLQEGNSIPTFCEELVGRDRWAGVLKSVGAKPVLGELDRVYDSVAWIQKDKNLEVVSFAFPLNPSVRPGPDYGSLPLLIKSILSWQKLLITGSEKRIGEWPRISEISEASKKGYKLKEVKLSNVPFSESIGASLDQDKLPASTSWGDLKQSVSTGGSKEYDNPLPWLKISIILLFVLFFMEGIYYFIIRIRSKDIIAIILVSFFFDSPAKSNIAVTTIGYNNQQSARSLAREVSSRTSIEMRSEVFQYVDIGEKRALQSPWLWVKNQHKVSDEKGRILDSVARWLRRGGFLVIEGFHGEGNIENFTVPLKGPNNSGWKAIPPDHEVMRSFHLLNSLPTCGEKVWRGYHFDGRLAILAPPYNFLDSILDQRQSVDCLKANSWERGTRIFINILMVALTTDYKKDQIHLPEILKRLR